MKIVILAAGKSSRFSVAGSGNPSKIFADFWGIPVLDLILARSKALKLPISLIVNDQFEHTQYPNENIVIQKSKYGTGAAVQEYLKQTQNNSSSILILPSDMPLIETETLQKFCNLTCDVAIGIIPTPAGNEAYGRIIFNDQNKVTKIAEYKDHPAKTEYVNSGLIYLSENALKLVPQLQENAHQEVFLTDIIELALMNNLNVEAIKVDASDVLGFNTREEYFGLLEFAQIKWRTKVMNSGAILQDPQSTYLSFDTQIESGAIVEPSCKFGLNVHLTKHAIVKSFSYLENCTVDGVVGPFAHIKSGTVSTNAQVGAFVQLKNATIAENTKIKHLAYIGDTSIGKNSNVGAGVVICNFDGKQKHRTVIEENAMIGANSTLIAPITIGKNAFLAAGSTYTDDVAENEFAIARTKQENKKLKDKS